MCEAKITPAGLRHLDRLPGKVRHAALTTILGPIAESPHRAGESLTGELKGLRSARRGDYRIIYEIIEDEAVVAIHRIQNRRDGYRLG